MQMFVKYFIKKTCKVDKKNKSTQPVDIFLKTKKLLNIGRAHNERTLKENKWKTVWVES